MGSAENARWGLGATSVTQVAASGRTRAPRPWTWAFALWLPGDELASARTVQVQVTYREGSTGTSWLHL